MLAARWCSRGLAPEPGATGLVAFDADLSALDLSPSDQLKPSPERCEELLDAFLEFPPTDEDRFCPLVEEETELIGALPFVFPGPPLTSHKARAPKLILRANGDDGDVLGAASPSSMALSSMDGEPEPPLETLSCRALPPGKAEGCVGEPDNPSDEMDMRRRCWACALAAAVAIGPG